MDEVRLKPFKLTIDEQVMLAWRRSIRRVILFGALYGVAIAGLLYAATAQPLSWVLAPSLMGTSIVLTRFVRIPDRIRKASPKTPILSNLLITRDGIKSVDTRGVEITLPWSIFTKVKLVRKIYLIVGTTSQCFIPRRVLSNDEEHFLVDRLRDIKLLP